MGLIDMTGGHGTLTPPEDGPHYVTPETVEDLKRVISQLHIEGEHDLAQACTEALDVWEGDQDK